MKLVTWNCNMAFRKKIHHLAHFKPDLLIIQECEHPDSISFDVLGSRASSAHWFGKNRHKGLGVFSFGDYHLEVCNEHNEDIKSIVPFWLIGPEGRFCLFAIWAFNPTDPDGTYVTQVWKAINHYWQLLTDNDCILLGDFNSNAIWDRPRRKGNHSDVVNFLKELEIESLYHRVRGEAHGKETSPTFFLYRHLDKTYHLDYCFVSEDLIGKLSSFEIGDAKTWLTLSDHLPVFIHIS